MQADASDPDLARDQMLPFVSGCVDSRRVDDGRPLSACTGQPEAGETLACGGRGSRAHADSLAPGTRSVRRGRAQARPDGAGKGLRQGVQGEAVHQRGRVAGRRGCAERIACDRVRLRS